MILKLLKKLFPRINRTLVNHALEECYFIRLVIRFPLTNRIIRNSVLSPSHGLSQINARFAKNVSHVQIVPHLRLIWPSNSFKYNSWNMKHNSWNNIFQKLSLRLIAKIAKSLKNTDRSTTNCSGMKTTNFNSVLFASRGKSFFLYRGMEKTRMNIVYITQSCLISHCVSGLCVK